MTQARKTPSSSADKPPSNTLAQMASQTQIEFELEFLGNLLQHHPDFLEGLRLHAKNLSTKKRYAEAIQMDRRIIRLCPEDALAHYNLACSYALLGQLEAALLSLRKAFELGYDDFSFLRKDHDLDSLRCDPRFKELLRKFEADSVRK